MNKFLKYLLAAILLPSTVFAQYDDANLWEKAAYGNLPGISYVQLYGINGGIPATFETVWPESAAYAPLTAAMSTPYCASSDAADAAAGTGARTITVGGLKTSFARFSETVTLNGTTEVNLATTAVLLIDTVEVATAGSGGLNAGIIQCGTGANTGGDPAVTHAYVPISSATTVAGAGNKSMSFIYGVPDNYTLICKNIRAGSVFATAASSTQVAIDGYTNLGIMKRYYGIHAHVTGSNPTGDPTLVKFPEKTIIIGKLAGPTGSNVGPASLSADCLLIADTATNSNQTLF